MRIFHLDSTRAMRGGQHPTLLQASLPWIGCEQVLVASLAGHARHGSATSTWAAVRRCSAHCDLIHTHDAPVHTLARAHRCGKPVVVSRRLVDRDIPPSNISVIYDAAPDERISHLRERHEPAVSPESQHRFLAVTPNSVNPLKGRDPATEAWRRFGVKLVASDNLMRDLSISRKEGFGSAILLGTLAGLPTIASSVGGISEVGVGGGTGLLVNNEAASIAVAIRRVQTDDHLRERMSRAVLNAVKARSRRAAMTKQAGRTCARLLRPRSSTLRYAGLT